MEQPEQATPTTVGWRDFAGKKRSQFQRQTSLSVFLGS